MFFPHLPATCARAKRRRLSLFLAAASLALAPMLRAAPPAAAETNLLAIDPGFESGGDKVDNLWDGVNSDGTLSGFTYSANVVMENGNFGPLAMPPSVAFIDLNGDGLPDLVTADPTGFFRFYPNSGTLTAPKFTSAEVIPLFVSLCQAPHTWDLGFNYSGRRDGFRFCPRFSLADWRHTGLLDLLIGNYFGEVFFIPNTGTAKQPVYLPTGGADPDPGKRDDLSYDYSWKTELNLPPTSVEKARVSTNDQGRYWANLISPAAYDWTGDGKLDLLCGEGTYSANAIHLLENVGSGNPKFSSKNHTVVAYGDGREQLIPTVADFNGDGLPDLVVADRTGQVSLYLSTAKPAAGLEVKRTSTLTFGGASKLPGLCSVYAADYNGDGLIDLIIGLPSGHLAVSLNTGTKTQPSFGPIQEIKGVDRLGRNIQRPENMPGENARKSVGWTTETSNYYGNALSYFTVVSAQEDPASAPPEGTHCLKAGYWPENGVTFPMPATGIPGTFRHFMLQYRGLDLNIGKTCHVSFKVKGTGMERLRWEYWARFYGYPDLVMEKNERGGVKDVSQHVNDWVHLGSDFSLSSDWSEVRGDFTPRYKVDALRDQKQMPGTFVVDFWAENMSSVIYLDDFHLTQSP
jgi:hypothetical protein